VRKSAPYVISDKKFECAQGVHMRLGDILLKEDVELALLSGIEAPRRQNLHLAADGTLNKL
jgi:hypothetical protein